jgi:hypothetical protein
MNTNPETNHGAPPAAHGDLRQVPQPGLNRPSPAVQYGSAQRGSGFVSSTGGQFGNHPYQNLPRPNSTLHPSVFQPDNRLTFYAPSALWQPPVLPSESSRPAPLHLPHFTLNPDTLLWPHSMSPVYYSHHPLQHPNQADQSSQ